LTEEIIYEEKSKLGIFNNNKNPNDLSKDWLTLRRAILCTIIITIIALLLAFSDPSFIFLVSIMLSFLYIVVIITLGIHSTVLSYQNIQVYSNRIVLPRKPKFPLSKLFLCETFFIEFSDIEKLLYFKKRKPTIGKTTSIKIILHPRIKSKRKFVLFSNEIKDPDSFIKSLNSLNLPFEIHTDQYEEFAKRENQRVVKYLGPLVIVYSALLLLLYSKTDHMLYPDDFNIFSVTLTSIFWILVICFIVLFKKVWGD